jgi:hypothetical protein
MNRHWQKNRLFATIVGLVAIGWLILALLNDPTGPDWLGATRVGLVLGTMFGQVSLAAAWCALGPFSLIRRLPLSFVWLAAIVVALGCNIARNSNSPGFQLLLTYSGTLLFQWLVLQTPIWLLVARYGLRVRCVDDVELANDSRDKQFGIRQIMALTALVALVLGIGRLLLGGMQRGTSFGKPVELVAYACLALANVLVSAPAIGVMLLPRVTVAALCGALLFSAFATAIELSALNLIDPGPPSNAQMFWVLSLVNLVQCGWVLAVLFLLRLGGYRITLRQSSFASVSS